MEKKEKFYKLPAALLQAGLTARAVLAYCILADRAELSGKGGERYKDQYGVYIIYRIEELAAVLGVGERTARYCLAELEDGGYIATRKQGRTRPQKIYVLDTHDRQKIAGHEGGDRQKIAGHDRQKIAGHSTYTNSIYTDPSSSSPAPDSSTPAARLGTLLELIERCAGEVHVPLSERDTLDIAGRYLRESDTIQYPAAWLRAVVANYVPLPSGSGTKKKPWQESGYKAGYDITEYESTSVLDEEDE